jgi:hypothetical protein
MTLQWLNFWPYYVALFFDINFGGLSFSDLVVSACTSVYVCIACIAITNSAFFPSEFSYVFHMITKEPAIIYL